MKYHQHWQARAIRPDGASEWFDARVPGNVQYDYGRVMGWGDMQYADNANRYGDTEDYSWEYRTQLCFERTVHEQAVFVAEGVDYQFDILVDGECRLTHEGMFTRVEVPLKDTDRELIVRIHPHPKSKNAKYTDRAQAQDCVKPPVCYGWDWHPRLLVSGIWQDAYVETRTADFIRRCEPFYELSNDFSHAEIRFETECDVPVDITLCDPDGTIIGTGDHFMIDNPRLWWYSGQGEAALYTYTARTQNHERTGHIGLRRARIVMSEGSWDGLYGFPKGRNPAPIQLELNGRRIFAKGSNWVNPDVFNGHIDAERYEALIQLAHDANMNIFRCWGGSGISKPAFYDLCDRLGIMVWVEFPLACNCYPDEAHYLTILEQEARAIISSLRSHPSVVMYCGGNELFNSWSLMTDQSMPLRLLNKLCYELDPKNAYLMTSPVFGMAHGGYTFYDPDAHCDVFTLFQNAHNTAYTEFGVPGITALEDLKKIIPENELFPVEKTPSWRLHHAFGSWGEERWLCRDVLERYAQHPLDSIEKMIDLAGWLQCEGYKAIFEEARRQAPYCSMAVNWCYCEPWITAAGNSLITYPAKPKPAYFAVQSALRPVLFSARIPKFDWKAGETFTAQLWLLNDTFENAQADVDVSIRLGDQIYPMLTWHSGCAAANQIGPSVNWVLPDADADEMTLILSAGEWSSEYRLCYLSRTERRVSRQLNV
ncbi:MAG: hypothetical protein IKK75_12520 [Clostridia bacterium]|nr:hypothetical protein [Clostridia bacterium]